MRNQRKAEKVFKALSKLQPPTVIHDFRDRIGARRILMARETNGRETFFLQQPALHEWELQLISREDALAFVVMAVVPDCLQDDAAKLISRAA